MGTPTPERVPPALAAQIEKAVALLQSADSFFEGQTIVSLEELLRRSIGTEESVDRLRRLSLLLSDFERFQRGRMSESSKGPGVLRIEQTPFEARLTLLPPGPGGRIEPEEIERALQGAKITHGIREEALRAACLCATDQREVVHRLVIASGTPAEDGQDGQISFSVRAFDKRLLLDMDRPFFGDLVSLIEEVKAGTIVARITPSTPGKPGLDLQGRVIPQASGNPLRLEIGEGLQPSDSGPEFHALTHGSLVVGEDSIDLIPFHVVDGQLNVGQDISFDGNVLVSGHVTGPVRIQARDIYIAGNVEAASLSATGDIWVGGGIQGKAVVESEGRLFARALTDTTVRAMGNVVIGSSILESRVGCGGRILVHPERGVIEGGELSAHLGIQSHTLGSSFGLMTVLRVGREDLCAAVRSELDKRIKENEDALLKIEEIKGTCVRDDGGRSDLPVDREVRYIAALKKEIQALLELRSLKRRRKRLESSSGPGPAPSIVATGQVHPPVLMEIEEASETLQDRHERVAVTKGTGRRISIQKSGETARSRKTRKLRGD